MSLHRIIIFGTIASIMVLSLGTVASARQAGTKLQDQKLAEKVTQSTTIDPTTKAEVAKFIALSIQKLNSVDPSDVRSGREMLVSSMMSQQVNPAFRPLFAAMILPDLKKIISSPSSFNATNALEVVKSLQCPDSIVLLADQTVIKNQPNASLRLVAAGGLATLRTPIELTSGQADGVLKTISSSAAKEADWMIAAYDIQALCTFSTSPKVPKASQAFARTAFVATLGSIVLQIRKGTVNPEMIRAVNRSLAIYMRDQVPLASQADVASVMKALEPTLKVIQSLPLPSEPDSLVEAYAQVNKTVGTIQKTFLGGKGSASGGATGKPATPPSPPAKK